ncbi:hypothetical protein [Embleya sp. NPDC005575]|uniref:hypothetical protein n=1 Tax=Embleya sp. NPDC005575 TaxID=3156892 RepID=UPI0033AD7498
MIVLRIGANKEEREPGTVDNISTHRPSTANPRRTQVDVVLPRQRVAEAVGQSVIAEVRTANPRRTNLMDTPPVDTRA